MLKRDWDSTSTLNLVPTGPTTTIIGPCIMTSFVVAQIVRTFWKPPVRCAVLNPNDTANLAEPEATQCWKIRKTVADGVGAVGG